MSQGKEKVKLIKDISNQKFGRWTVTDSYKRENLNTYWFCKCQCGATGWVALSSLTRGASRSCGCYRDEVSRTKFKDVIKEKDKIITNLINELTILKNNK